MEENKMISEQEDMVPDYISLDTDDITSIVEESP